MSIPLFKVRMSDDAPDQVAEVLKSGYIGEGPKVVEFERALNKKLFESRHIVNVITTNSATSAEHLGYHLFKGNRLNDGDEVLATPLTCTATNWPIMANGLKIKWVDVDPTTLNMDLDDLARKITPTTKAISLVHWGGYPVDMKRVHEICAQAGAKFGFYPVVFQDCAHATATQLHGRPMPLWGGYCTYSFQAIKHLTCGDGGALVTIDNNIVKRAKLLRWYGIDRGGDRKDFRCEADIPEWGYKFHMNDISATIGLANLSLVDDTVRCHRDNAAFYNTNLVDIPGLTLLKNEEGFDSSYWIYTMRVEDRDGFTKAMTDRGIQVSRVHERNDKHSCVSEFKSILPNLEVVSQDMICIPVGWWVTEEERHHIVESIKAGW